MKKKREESKGEGAKGEEAGFGGGRVL